MLDKITTFIEKKILLIYILITIVFGFLTFFINYNIPNESIWDEVYHISSAEKYIQNVHFMEAHPPLAKLIIASGEVLINPNTSYDDLNFAAKICLSNTPENYKYTEGGVEKTQDTIDLDNGKTRKMNLLDVREKTQESIDKTNFTEVDSIKEYPEYFSFCGYRFMPVLMASFLPMLFFILIYLITKNPNITLFASAFVAFDNALIVHFRSAMLDSIQLFFILLALIFTVNGISKVIKDKKLSLINYLLIAFFVSLTIATKHNGLIFLILPLIVGLVELFVRFDLDFKKIKKLKLSDKFVFLAKSAVKKKSIIINLFAKAGIVLSIIFLIYASVFFVHIALGQNIQGTNENRNGVYKAGENYLEQIKERRWFDINTYVYGFEDNLAYMDQYHEGVPKLNLQSETENGSYPSNWPLMNRTISYRWDTSNGKDYKYIYLIGNPFIWLISIISVLVAIVVILGKLIYKVDIERKSSFGYLILFTSLYLLYMAAMLYIITVRVMYLYHYIIPLVLSMATVPILIDFFWGGILEKDDLEIYPGNKPFYIYSFMLVIICVIVFGFIFFSPFTYHLPLNSDQFDMRNWFDFWLMRKAGS